MPVLLFLFWRMDALTKQLSEAKETLQALQDGLPRYHSLVTDNRANEAQLQKDFREGSGKFTDLTAAKTASATAQELLEQHQSDTEAAKAEVQRLEAEAQQAERQRAFEASMKRLRRVQATFRTKRDALAKNVAACADEFAQTTREFEAALSEARQAARAAGHDTNDVKLEPIPPAPADENLRIEYGMRWLGGTNPDAYHMSLAITRP